MYDTSEWQIDQRLCPVASGQTRRKKAVVANVAEKTATALDKTMGGTSTVIHASAMRRGVATKGGEAEDLSLHFNLPRHRHQEVLEDLPLSDENREKINAFFGSSKIVTGSQSKENSSKRLDEALRDQNTSTDQSGELSRKREKKKLRQKKSKKSDEKRAAVIAPPDVTTDPSAVRIIICFCI